MSYCAKLSEKLNKWRDMVEEFKKAKDNYLASFSANDKTRYQELKEEVKREEESYKRFKEEECFEVVIIKGKEEKLFGPEYEALERLYSSLYLQLFEEGEIIIKDGRVIEISLFGLKKDNDTEEIIKKRNLAFSNVRYFKNLQWLYCSNNNLQELPTLPDGLQRLYCRNCLLTEKAKEKILMHPNANNFVF